MLRRPDKVLTAILALALLARLCFALGTRVIADPGDIQYGMLAFQRGIGVEYAPLYPLFLRLVYRLFGAFNYNAVYMAQSVAGAFVPVLVYAAASRLGGRRAGLIAAILSALYPGFVFTARGMLVETWCALIVAAMMAVAARGERGRREAAILGALTGVGVMLKPVFVFFLPGFLMTVRKRLLLCGAFVAILTPLVIHNSIVSREPVPGYKKSAYDLTFDLYAKNGWRMVDLVYFNTVLLFSWQPGESARAGQGAERGVMVAYYLRKYSYLLLLWLGLAALARFWRKEQAPVALPVLLAVLLAILFTRVVEPRFRVFLEPLLIVYLAIAIERLLSPAAGREALIAQA
jgi:4-amino-4-deoxy-L-arabinose transferase-like glycosyltransferase